MEKVKRYSFSNPQYEMIKRLIISQKNNIVSDLRFSLDVRENAPPVLNCEYINVKEGIACYDKV